MTIIHRAFRLFFLGAFFIWGVVRAQFIVPDSLILRLPEKQIHIPLHQLKSDTICLDSIPLFPYQVRMRVENFVLKENLHYIRLQENNCWKIFLQGFSPQDTLEIRYRPIPFPYPRWRPLFSLVKKDSITRDSSGASAATFLQRFESVFSQESEGLQKSGTFVRGFQIGNNQNLTLNSSLNLFLKGTVADNVTITAALTDENTPIQPEGNTRQLNEVDKVYITIETPMVNGTIGDFDYKNQQSRFENIQRKLQGIWVKSANPYGQMQALYSTTRGRAHRNIFLGQEGNQGPYVLTGQNGERNIIILAGTERVYINGKLMTRGEQFDYVIDYTTGELVFTSRQLISSDMRIEVDFEYLDARQRFLRNFAMASYGNQWKHLKTHLSFFQEQDNLNNVLADSDPLTDEEKEIVKRAGDDPSRAVQNGWLEVGKGNGSYSLRDTLIQGQPYSYFVYNKDSGEYVVSFTFVGLGNGSYIREKIGYYRFVGVGKGDYDPIIRVPLPQKNRLMVGTLAYDDSNSVQFFSRFAYSLFDNNYLSSLDDDDNGGKAGEIRARWSIPQHLLPEGMQGKAELQWVFRDSTFQTLDRYYQADYLKYWNQQNFVREREEQRELHSEWEWKNFRYRLAAGELLLGRDRFTRRFQQNLTVRVALFQNDLELTQVKGEGAEDRSYFSAVSQRLTWHLRGDASFYQTFLQEYRDLTGQGYAFGSKFREAGVGMEWKRSAFQWSNLIKGKRDYIINPLHGYAMEKQADIWQFLSELQYSRAGQLQSRMTLHLRDKRFDAFYKQFQGDKFSNFGVNPLLQDTSWVDRKSYSINWQVDSWHFRKQLSQSMEYQLMSDLTSLKEKVYVRVDNQTGNYRYDEELKEFVPDPNGDYILVIIPGRKYIPTSNVNARWQIQWRPERRTTNTATGKWLQSFQFFNRLVVEEKTTHRDLKDIYLLNLRQFQKEGQTIRGNLLLQTEMTLFPFHTHWNVLLSNRYQQQLVNLYLDQENNERRIVRQQSAIFRYRHTVQLKQELEIFQRATERSVMASPARNRDVREIGFSHRISHRVFAGSDNSLEWGWVKGSDRRSNGRLNAHYWKIQDRFTASVGKQGRLLLQGKWILVEIDQNLLNLPFPYEMAEGKRPGQNWEWLVRYDYFVSNYLTFSLDYRGRKDAIFRRTIHTGQMELRAYF